MSSIAGRVAGSENCPVCGEQYVSQCRCPNKPGLHTMESLKNGHGRECPNGHRWFGDLVYNPVANERKQFELERAASKKTSTMFKYGDKVQFSKFGARGLTGFVREFKSGWVLVQWKPNDTQWVRSDELVKLLDDRSRGAGDRYNRIVRRVAICERIAYSFVVGSRYVPFDNLPAITRDDIISEISERFGIDYEYDAKANLTGLDKPPMFLVRDMPVRSIIGYNRNPSILVVDKYVKMLKSGSEAPPILVDGNRFIDGGHRFAAYVKAGRKTIPAVDVGRLFKLWPEWMEGRAFELERAASGIG